MTPDFDKVLKDLYRPIIEEQITSFSRFLDTLDPGPPPTVWQTLKYRWRNLKYKIRHSVCCHREEDW